MTAVYPTYPITLTYLTYSTYLKLQIVPPKCAPPRKLGKLVLYFSIHIRSFKREFPSLALQLNALNSGNRGANLDFHSNPEKRPEVPHV